MVSSNVQHASFKMSNVSGAVPSVMASCRSAPPAGSFVVQCFVSPLVLVDGSAAGLGNMRLVRLTASSTIADLLHQLRVPPGSFNEGDISVRAAKGDGTVHASLSAYRPDAPLWGQDGFVFPFLVKVVHARDPPEGLAPHSSLGIGSRVSPSLHGGVGGGGNASQVDPLDLSDEYSDDNDGAGSTPFSGQQSPLQQTQRADGLSMTTTSLAVTNEGGATQGTMSLPPSSPTAYRRQKRMKREEERRRRDQVNAKRAETIAAIEARQQAAKEEARQHAAAREAARQVELAEELRQQALRDEQRLMRQKQVLERKAELMSERETFVATIHEDFRDTMRSALQRASLSSPFTAPKMSPPSLAAVKETANGRSSPAPGMVKHQASMPFSAVATEAASSYGLSSSTRPATGASVSSTLESILSDLHAKIQRDSDEAAALQRSNLDDARRAAEQSYLEHVAERMRARKAAANREVRARTSQAEFALTSVVFQSTSTTPPLPKTTKAAKR